MKEASETRSFSSENWIPQGEFFFAQIPFQFQFHALLAMLNDEIDSERAFLFLCTFRSHEIFF